MVEFESRDLVVVIGADQPARFRTRFMLNNMDFYVLEFRTVDELRQTDTQPYAVVMIADCLDTSTAESLHYFKHIERLIVISQTNIEKTVVAALYAGAHFYFDILEPDSLLSIRLYSALRPHGAKMLTKIIAPPFKFDVKRRQVFLGNKPICLSPKEYLFAEYIFSRPDKVITKSELMLSVWSLPGKFDARRVDTAACRVRKKMQLSSHITGWELAYKRRAGFILLSAEPGLGSCVHGMKQCG